MDPIITLATPAAILAVVQLAKDLGLSGKASLVAAVVLGVAFSVLEFYFGAVPVYGAARSGLLLGLGAAGLYDMAKIAGPREVAHVEPLPELK